MATSSFSRPEGGGLATDGEPESASPRGSRRLRAAKTDFDFDFDVPVGLSEREQLLLERSMRQTKALQQLTSEKEQLHQAITEREEALRASESARRSAEERVGLLEAAMRTVQSTAGSAMAASCSRASITSESPCPRP